MNLKLDEIRRYSVCIDCHGLLGKLDSLQAAARAVLDATGRSHEDDSDDHFHYVTEVDNGALDALRSALEQLSA